MKNNSYRKDFPHKLYIFFANYSEAGVPSFLKFARSIGVTSEDVEKWREHKEFNRAYRECAKIRRDYLIDNALAKRFDASFAKFLLTEEDGSSDSGEENLNIILKVIDESGA